MTESNSYSDSHQDRVNLLIHLTAVPLFIAGVLWTMVSIVQRDPNGVGAGFAAIGVSMAGQGIGHRREQRPPEPFDGFLDFVTRVFVEQFVKFPTFVINGGWWRNWRHKE